MMRVIRRRPPQQSGTVPSIALSAYARPEDRRAAMAAGFDEYLVKPTLPSDVLAAVSRLLGTARRHRVAASRAQG